MRGWHARGWKGSKIGRYANIFVRGAKIAGKPMLWLPLPTAPKRIAGQTPSPKLYRANIGPLVPIKGKAGRPLLAGDSLRAVEGRSATVGQLKTGAKHAVERAAGRRGKKTVKVPIFVGIASVNIPARIDMDAIFARVREQLPNLYAARLKAQK
jgi:hypothetical protein